MDSNTFTALVAVSSTLLGVTVAGGIQYYISQRDDERKFKHEEAEEKRLNDKRKTTAYRTLKYYTDRIKWKRHDAATEGPRRVVSKDEFEGIETTLARNYDVLDESTLKAWDSKFIVQTVADSTDFTAWVSFDEFLNDVEKHYEEYKKRPMKEKAVQLSLD